uniref:Vesicle-fusing ATPase n=1 Tax=Heterorhabditis bacteriophora TaxID=37862 RepID=A0A1I7W9R7_HETBA
MAAHGKDFLVKVFGPKAKGELNDLGGVDKVAVALSRSFTSFIQLPFILIF